MLDSVLGLKSVFFFFFLIIFHAHGYTMAIRCKTVQSSVIQSVYYLSHLRKFQYTTSGGEFSCTNLLFWREKSN